MSRLPASEALARFKVLDLTRVRAGPTCVRQLADWGADVVKIEMPEGSQGGDMGGPRHGPDFQNLHRNKRSMTLDRKRPGFDQVAQGMGGLMWITGLPGQGPVRAGVPIADLGAGIYCALGILVALLEREVSGEGQWVRSSLLQAQIALTDFQSARWLIAKEVPGQAGNDHPTSIPTGVFETSDGHINIAASGQHIFKRFCAAVGAEHLAGDPQFATDQLRSKNRAALNAAIAEKTRTRPSREWIDILNVAGVPCGPIYKMNEVFEDPQVRHLGMAADVRHPKLGDIQVVNQPVELSRTPSHIRYATPERGEHTDEVLRALDFDDQAIAGLRARKIV